MYDRLTDYIPDPQPDVEIELREDLAPVVERMREFIPREEVWNLFSSYPTETGGRIVFPYCRVDSALMVTDMSIHLSIESDSDFERQEKLQNACRFAFKAVMWTEVGFQGIDNLAESSASVNWTSGVGHFVNDEERAIGIKTEGRNMYEKP